MIKKSVAVWLPVVLRLQTEIATDKGNELLNIVFGDVAVWYIKEGGDWAELTMTSANWDDCSGGAGGSGVYKVQFPAGAVDTVGKFIYWVNVDAGASAGLSRLYYGMEEVVENTNDDIAGLIAGLNNFDVTSEKVLLNDGTQGQIDDIETASGNLDASVSSRAVPGDITAAHAITDAKIDTIETNNITGVPE